MNILIVEDDRGISELISERITNAGYQCVKSFTGDETVKKIANEIIDFMILDYKLPDMDAAELLDILEEKEMEIPAFVCSTGQGDEMVAVNMMKRGARDYIIKDARFLEILPRVIKREIKNLKNEIELEKARVQKENMIAEIMQVKEDAVKASKVKSEFLANMSHELRTPLNGIMGFAQLLKKTTLTHEQMEFVNTILLSSNNLLQLINSILDFTKIEAAKLTLEPVDSNIRDIFTNAVNMIIPIVEKKGLKFISSVDECIPHYLKIDGLRITQILMNLFGNAVKFTEKGQIDFIVNLIQKKTTYTEIEIIVQDTGIGIPEDKQKKILEAFTQVDASTTRRYGGSGLGLTITNNLLNLMDSQLIVNSHINQGSRFSFRLILENCSDICNETEESKDEDSTFNHLEERTILLVEDNIINQTVTKHIIQSSYPNFKIFTAENGLVALKLFPKIKPDIVFMDLQMPLVDGFEATLKIQNEYPEQKTIIIALTADARKDVIERCQASGMDDFILKPIEIDQIKTIIQKYV